MFAPRSKLHFEALNIWTLSSVRQQIFLAYDSKISWCRFMLYLRNTHTRSEFGHSLDLT